MPAVNDVFTLRGVMNYHGNTYKLEVRDEDDVIPGKVESVIPVAGFREFEMFTPLVYSIPSELLAVKLAQKRNISMKMRIDEHRKNVNFDQIFHSKVK